MKDKKADDQAATKVLPGSAPSRAQFEFKVYPDELGYVENRRRAHGLPLDDRGSDKPTTQHGVVGLAFSGGGIRSATFNLGVAQALHRWGLFKYFDLMSTVSGGGFVGSGITSLMSQEGQPSPSEFPFGPNPFGGERPTLVHLRNNSNYLTPKGLIDYIRMFAVLVRGIILNFLVLVPFLLVPCMIITLFYGRQLLERLEYDDTVDRTVALMRTALDRSNAATDDQGKPMDPVVVGEKQPVKPFLELLKNQAFLPPDLVRNDEPVAEALRLRNPGFRDVNEPLATGSMNPFSPLTFLPAADLEKVAKRLIDAELLLAPATVEELWVAEHVLRATPPADKRSSPKTPIDRMRQRLRPHLRKGVAAARETSGRKPLFMPFVTEESLLEALRITELVEKVPCKGGAPADGLGCWSFKNAARPPLELGLGSDGKAAARRAERQAAVRRWMEATQAFYDQKLFDPEALQHHLARIGVDRAVAYNWPDDAPGHEEIEMAAKLLWADLGGEPTVAGLFMAARQSRDASSTAYKRKRKKDGEVSRRKKGGKVSIQEKRKTQGQPPAARDSLLAKDLEDRGAELVAELGGAGLLVKDRRCPAKVEEDEKDWVARTERCKFVRGQLHRLPGLLFDREYFETSWFLPKVQTSFWSPASWFGPPDIRYGQRRSEEDLLEIEAARAELALRPGTVLEVMSQLSYGAAPPAAGRRPPAAGRLPLIDARAWEPRMDSRSPGADLPKSLLKALEEEGLVRCDAEGLETCRFSSRQSVHAIPGLLYRHHFYNRQWFIRYFAVPKPEKPSWLEDLGLDDQQKKQAWKVLLKNILEWRTNLEGDLDEQVRKTIREVRVVVGATEVPPAGAGGAEPAAVAGAGGGEPVALAGADVESVPLADRRRELAELETKLRSLETKFRSLLEDERDVHVVLYRARWEKAWTDKRGEILAAAGEDSPATPATLVAGLKTLLSRTGSGTVTSSLEQEELDPKVERKIQNQVNSVFKRLQTAGHLAPVCKYKNSKVNKLCDFEEGSDFDRAVQWMMGEADLGAAYEAQAIGGARNRAGPVERVYEALVRGYFLAPNWNPRQLNLPFTKFVAISGLVLVLLFPLLTLVSAGVPGRGIPARGALRRGLDRLVGFIARAARFFRHDRSFSWFMVLIAAAGFLDLQPYLIYHWHHLNLGADWSMALSAVSIAAAVMAGPALSFFQKFGRTIVIAVVALLGPLLPFMIYLSLLNELIYHERWPTREGYVLQWMAVVLFFLLAALVVHLFLLTLNPNSTGMHTFYKGRLAEAYLLAETARGDIEAGKDRPLSEICPDGSGSPYHLLNVSLNLQASDDPEVRDRNSDFFIFSRFFVGGGKNTGYCRTKQMQRVSPQLSLGGAMAVSAAAAAPNMGAFTLGPLVILLALLNIRLGYWVPNPKSVRRWLRRARRGGLRMGLKNLPARMLGIYQFRPGPYLFLRELLSRIDDKRRSVNVSDGGHLENTAIFELLRRRCKVIVAGDAEADAKMNFGGLAVLQRLARIDLSTEISMDTSGLRHENGKSARHFAIGEITYPETAWAPEETGYLIYLKSTLTGDESQVVLEYAGRRELFPHESTGDQAFDEAQFEAYRDLGSHSVDSLFEELGSPGSEVVGESGWLDSAVLELAKAHGRAT